MANPADTKPAFKAWRPFEEARSYVCSLGLKGQSEWRTWSKSGLRPSDVPNSPDRVYKYLGWKNWGDWLGTNYVANKNRNYKSFSEARKLARTLGLHNQNEWKIWAR